MKIKKIQRKIAENLAKTLTNDQNKSLINIIIGPRQVGKTTTAIYIAENWDGPVLYSNSELGSNYGADWIRFQWESIQRKDSNSAKTKLLILDEIQKIKGWSEIVKGLWDENVIKKQNIKLLLLGSSSLLLNQGISESLAGRFLLHRFNHWTYSEIKQVFGWDLDEWIYFGGYPGAAKFVDDVYMWKQYITDSLIETVINRDVLLLETVNKPALLRNLFLLAARFPAQIMSYNKMLGQMVDAGNTTTLAHYLSLLESAFLVSGLQQYSGATIRTKNSSPKLVIWNNALINALDSRNFEEARNDLSWWGRLVENAVGAHLVNNLQSIQYEVFYWRERMNEVDFVVRCGQKLWAIEVKSGLVSNQKLNGLEVFCKKYPSAIPVLVGSGGISLEEFFEMNPIEFFK